MLLSGRLLAETVVMDPQGASAPFKPEATNKAWVASCACDRPGVWSAAFELKKPQEEAPLYRGRCLLVVGGADDPSRYAAAKGLEIVPKAPLSVLKPGSLLPVAIHLDGLPIEGKIAVTPANGTIAFFSTGKDRPAEIRLPSAGVYLLTASHRGQTFALTFSVATPAGHPP
jgi:hypothetical protein